MSDGDDRYLRHDAHSHFWIWVVLFGLCIGSWAHGMHITRIEHQLKTNTTEDETEMRDSKRLQER